MKILTDHGWSFVRHEPAKLPNWVPKVKGFCFKQQIGLKHGRGGEIFMILLRGLFLTDVNITSKEICKCQSVVDLRTVRVGEGNMRVGGGYLQQASVFVRKVAEELSPIRHHDATVKHEQQCQL